MMQKPSALHAGALLDASPYEFSGLLRPTPSRANTRVVYHHQQPQYRYHHNPYGAKVLPSPQSQQTAMMSASTPAPSSEISFASGYAQPQQPAPLPAFLPAETVQAAAQILLQAVAAAAAHSQQQQQLQQQPMASFSMPSTQQPFMPCNSLSTDDNSALLYSTFQQFGAPSQSGVAAPMPSMPEILGFGDDLVDDYPAAACPYPAAADMPPLMQQVTNVDELTVPSESASTTSEHPHQPASAFAVVQFKHEVCMYSYTGPATLRPGDFVVVEADRGTNVGCVQSVQAHPPTYAVPNRIVRPAEQSDIAEFYAVRRNEDEKITRSVQNMASSVGLGCKIVDTEFQTDGQKLTVYYSSRHPIDFRKLQRSLFRGYHCRIWLVNWSEVEARLKQADRCLAVPLCAKLGSRLAQTTNDAPAPAPSAKGSQPRQRTA